MITRGFFLVQLQIARRVGAHEGVVHVPAQHRMSAVTELVFQHNAHQLFCRRTHVLETLTEGDHGKSIVLQCLRDALGAEAGAAPAHPEGRQITYTDLYNWGLSGTPGSAERKYQLLNALGLPPRLSKKELVEAFNRLYTFEQLDELQLKILQE